MVNILGIDLTPGLEAIKSSTNDLFSRLDLSGNQQQQASAVQPRDPFAGLSYGNDQFQGLQLGGNPFAVLGTQLGASDPQTGWDALSGMKFNPIFAAFDQASAKAAAAKAASGQTGGQSSGQSGGTAVAGSTVGYGNSGGPSTGLDPNVAKWSTQAQQTFNGLVDPDVMLAIMTNESGGDPNIQNRGGYPAYGLFQLWNQPGLTPDEQFAAARKLTQEKLTEINASYATHGMSPDQRTRARDFALAWGGHFNYSTGQPDPNSRDPSGQTADQLAAVFLGNYDKIKAGRTQAGAGGAGLAGVTPGVGGSIMQEFGVTPTSDQYKAAGNPVYNYGAAYGMQGGGHPGVDWAVPLGTKVATPLGGTVSVVGNDHGTGYYYQNTTGGGADPDHSGEFAITLDNGDILILGHLSQINAQVGQRLNAGTLIGLSGGSDGAHVHVEYRQRLADGSYRVVDPRTMLGQPTNTGGQGQYQP